MPIRDVNKNTAMAASITPAVRTTSVNGSAVDLGADGGHDGATVYFVVGTITDGTHTPKLQESADNSSWSDVAASDQSGTLAALASTTHQKVGYVGSKRYIRAVVTVTGSPSTGGDYAAVAALGRARTAPVS